MIFIAGISIAVFFELLLIFKKNKSDADKILIIWMFLIAFHTFMFFINHTKVNLGFPFLLGLELPLPLIHGVMLYLYVATATHQLPGYNKVLLVHFIPTLAAYLYLITFYVRPADEKIYVYQNQGVGYEIFLTILYYAYSIIGVAYISWSLFLLRKHQKNIVKQFSNLEKVDLNWLRILILGMGVIWIVVIFIHNDVYHFIAVVAFVFLVGFFGIRQIAITPQLQTGPSNEKKKSKYEKSGLKEEKSEEYYEKLKKLVAEEKVYIQSELLINDLAAMLEIHPNHLSQIINEKEGKNFYEFINQYRIEEFKQLASSPKGKQYTILSLAFECGFNSKSSFNRYFKKSTGQTPSQYVTQLN